MAAIAIVGQDAHAQAVPATSSGSVSGVSPAASAVSGAGSTAGSTTATLNEVIVRSAESRDERRESTAGKIVVTRDELARFGDAAVAEVLNRVPGVTVSGVPGKGGEIRMRGLGNGYVSVLINGEPTSSSFSIDSLSPALIERIEVLRTPSSDKSAQAIAGTINIVLKQSVRQRQRDVKATVESQEGHPSISVSGQAVDRAGDISYTLAGEFRHAESTQPSTINREFRNPQGDFTSKTYTDSAVNVRNETVSLTPRVNWHFGDDDLFSVDGFAYYQQLRVAQTDRYTTTLGMPAFIARFELPGTPRRLSMLRGRLTWTHTLDDGATFETKLGANENRLRQNIEYESYDAQGQLQRQRAVDGRSTDGGFIWNGKYRTPWTSAHMLSAGWEGEQQNRADERVQTDITATRILTPVNSNESFGARVIRRALYAQDEWTINPSWSANLGLRWESLKTHSGGTDSFDNHSNVLSPSLQTLWKVPSTQGDQLRLALSRTYKAPTTRELSPRRYVGSTENTATSPDLQGNPELRPELAWGVDVGYEQRLEEDAGLLSANGSARRVRDVIAQELFYDQAQGLWISRPFNGGNARVYGLELEAKINTRKLIKTAPSADIRANVAKNWSKLDGVPGPDNRLAQQTPLSANLGADWRLERMPLTVGGNFAYTAGGLINLSSNRTMWTTARRQLDAYGLWRVNASTQVRLSLSNLLHQGQKADSTYADASGSLYQTSAYRTFATVRLAVEAKL
jgi:outer membrane receptor protein involved in Fe transport